jgi:3-oxoacyl-[acyl-carrier protein] reductase
MFPQILICAALRHQTTGLAQKKVEFMLLFTSLVLTHFATWSYCSAMSTPPVVLVTGASRGLGRGIAQHCAAAGCSVAVHYAGNEAAAKETITLCKSVAVQPSQQFIHVRGNLAVAAERAEFFGATLSAFGRLDALVNNAGMAPRTRADITDTSEASYDEVMSVNLKGPYFLSQLAANHWLKASGQSLLPGGYKLIFITSVSADTASVNRGEYCLSKAGLAMAAQLWATRLAGSGTQVFEIRPGIMETDMTAGVKEKYDKLIAEGLIPQGRWGKPEDVGLAVVSILNGHLPFSTGNVIHVDGGFHLRKL